MELTSTQVAHKTGSPESGYSALGDTTPALMPGKPEIYGDLFVTRPIRYLVNRQGKIEHEFTPFESALNQMVEPANIQRLVQIHNSLYDQMEGGGASTEQLVQMGEDLKEHYLTPHDSDGRRIWEEVPSDVREKALGLLQLPTEKLNALVYGDVEKIEKVDNSVPVEPSAIALGAAPANKPITENVESVESVEPEVTEVVAEHSTVMPVDSLGQLLSTIDVEDTPKFPTEAILRAIMKGLGSLGEITDVEERKNRLNNALLVLNGVPHPAKEGLSRSKRENTRLSAELAQTVLERDIVVTLADNLKDSIHEVTIKRKSHYVVDMDSVNPITRSLLDGTYKNPEAVSEDDSSDDEASSEA